MPQKAKSTGRQSSNSSFDLEQLRELIEMMEQHGVTEVNLRQGDQHWRLRRGSAEGSAAPVGPPAYHLAPPVAPPPVATPMAPVAPTAAANAPAGESGESNTDDGLIDIVSPTVGTFYASPSPDEPTFVKVGSKVSEETVVCLVEAMKVFNQIQAECSGVIEKILVKDGDAVDFGQPLFKVRPA